MKKYVAADPESFDLGGFRLEGPRVVKTERSGDMVCYTMEAKQGMAKGTYRLCWKDGKVRSVRQLSLSFE